MPFKIERALSGLFDTFKLQSQGALPYLMAEGVQPTVDVTTFALRRAGLRCIQFPTAGLTAITGTGIVTSTTLADDVLLLGATMTMAAILAGATSSTALVAYPPGQQGITLALINANLIANIGQQVNTGQIPWVAGIWLPEGTVVQIECTFTTAANSHSIYGSLAAYQPSAET